MEKAVWDEIRSELSALKERVAALEKQVDEYEKIEAEGLASGAPAEEPAPAAEEEPATVEAGVPADRMVEEPSPAAPETEEPETTGEEAGRMPEEASPVTADPSPAAEDPILTGPADSDPIDLGIDLPDFGTGIRSINDVQSRKVHKRLLDSGAATPKWKTDLPGTPVRNIISAISLNDRVLMINKLFSEDPQLFRQTLADLNAMESFADAEDYVSGHFSGWKMDSEPVYRFMMAVRRKLDR